MNEDRQAFLQRLLAEATTFDESEQDRRLRYRNITRDTGRFLSILVRLMSAERVLEVGASNGYSTIWLADGLLPGGCVMTIESDPRRAQEATANFSHLGMQHLIELRETRAQDVLPGLQGQFDLVFLDAERDEYVELWPEIHRLLRPSGGLLVVDNAVSHRDELGEFFSILEGSPQFVTALVPVGKGEFLALSRDAASAQGWD